MQKMTELTTLQKLMHATKQLELIENLLDKIDSNLEKRLKVWLDAGIISLKEFDKEMTYLRSEDYGRSI